jgi:hypothetical protein
MEVPEDKDNTLDNSAAEMLSTVPVALSKYYGGLLGSLDMYSHICH